MKRNVFFIVTIMFLTIINLSAKAQNGNMEDVVYLKNGSVIHGIIIEQIPNESLKVKTKDGNVFVYKMTEVEKLTKEEVAKSSGVTYSSNANIVIPSYKELRANYNPHMYVGQPGEPYSPALNGVCSWIIPGLGQMISGETGRGLGFLGGYLGCYLVVGIGSGIAVNSYSEGGAVVGSLITVVGALGMVTVDIWSIVDAVHVAKVKDMYYNDMRNKTTSLKLEVAPYVDQIAINNQVVRPTGLTLRVRF